MRISPKSLVGRFAAAAIALALTAALGCGPAAEAPGDHKSDHEHGHNHDHADGQDPDHGADEADAHDHAMPTDYRQAIAQIQAATERIGKAIKSGDFEAAHEPLDAVDPIIGQLMPIAKQSGVPRKEWETINVARRELRAEFDKLHASIDAGERPDYAAAQGAIEERLKRLQSVAEQLDAQVASPPAATGTSTSKEGPP
jgi:hypothetical protein